MKFYHSMEQRLIARSVVLPDGCWMWMGRVEPNGYAKIGVYEGGGRENERVRVRNYWVHRVAYETFHGPIPEGHDVDHECRFRLCIHPNHIHAKLAAKNRSEGAVRGNQRRYG